jgi:hypothetical protein
VNSNGMDVSLYKVQKAFAFRTQWVFLVAVARKLEPRQRSLNPLRQPEFPDAELRFSGGKCT